jgi:hypothetical protein
MSGKMNHSVLRAFSFTLFFVSLQTAQAQTGPVITGQPTGEVINSSNGLPVGVPETTGGYSGEAFQRFDSQSPWMHGYYQPIPAYGGYGAYRPYNYKHVLSQSQAAGGWGMQPTMPYSQQFWHRYRRRASMRPRILNAPIPRTPVGGAAYSRRVLTAPQQRAQPIPRTTAPQLRFPPARSRNSSNLPRL